MCIETILRDAQSHLNVVANQLSGFITDELTWDHIRDAKIEIDAALYELRNAPRNALIETISESGNVN